MSALNLFGKKISAVAFDIDGTLYPLANFYLRVAFYYLRHLKFYLAFNKVRKQIRCKTFSKDFYKMQAELFAEREKISEEAAHQKIFDIAYDGIKKFFVKTKTFAHVAETFELLNANKIKIGILSDFPVEQKGDVWGLTKYCDALVSSESVGTLKPDAKPFLHLAEKLDVPPTEILYVGNSEKYDIVGAKKTGMMAALIVLRIKKNRATKKSQADFVFASYKEFQKIIFGTVQTKTVIASESAESDAL